MSSTFTSLAEGFPRALSGAYRKAKRLCRTVRGTDIAQGPQVRIKSERYGSDYGGWTVASGTLHSQSTVYSVGVGQDVSFDLALIAAYGLTVHAFDPTPCSLSWLSAQRLPPQFVLHPTGLGAFDGDAPFEPPRDPTHVSCSIPTVWSESLST